MAEEEGAGGGLLKAVAAEKAFLPRTISFVRATGSSSGSLQPASSDPDRDGPVPPYYLYPRHRLRALCECHKTRQLGRGLINAGNTCFFNSILQTLTYTRPLQNFLLSGEHAEACTSRSDGIFCAICLFQQHAKEAVEGGRSPLHPKVLLKHLKQFGGKAMQLGRQEDAHEFLLHFLDACHKAALQPALTQGAVPALVQRTTLIHQLFGGYLRSQVVCQDCKHESNTFDPFLDLSLEVRTAATLEKALEGFTKSELLSGQNRYRCKQCQRPVEVTKRFFLHTLPPLMAFQLKRFEFSQGSRGKIVKSVSFGTCVDLARFTSHPKKEAKYRLYAVVVHDGHSAKSGHYYAFVRHCSGTWYQFDDDKVRPVSEQVVLRTQAYLLFYEAAQLPPDLRSQPVNGLLSEGPLHCNGFINGAASSSTSKVVESPAEGVANGVANGVVKGASPTDALHASPRPQPNGSSAAVARAEEEEAIAEEGASEQLCEELPHRRLLRLGRRRRLQVLRRCRSKRLRAARAASAAEEPGPKARRLDLEAEEELSQVGRPGLADKGAKAGRPPPADEEDAKVPAPPKPAAPERRPARIAEIKAASLAPDYKTQYGRAAVSSWEDGAQEAPSQSFVEAQRQLQPGPSRRDELDTEYDAGKRKHKPRKPQPEFSGKSAFDQEQVRRIRAKASRAKGRGRFANDDGGGKAKGRGRFANEGGGGKAKGRGGFASDGGSGRRP